MRRVIFTAIIIGLLSSTSLGYSGGSGTAEEPYQIATKADLLTLAGTTTDYNKCFILTADIDMEGQVFTTAIIAADTDSSNGFQGTAFTGTLDGDGYTITNFTINGGSNWYLGLFGYIGSGGQIKNLSLESFAVIDGYSRIGGLAGYNHGSISDCYSTGTVTNENESWCSGGLVGYSDGNISNCCSMGAVSGYGEVGGLVGYNPYGNISNCSSTGTVEGFEDVGGLTGFSVNGSISNCSSTGTVEGFEAVGGLMGFNINSSISNCCSTGSVNGSFDSQDVGGLVGLNSRGNISNCYSRSTVNGASGIGGLVGYNYIGGISDCYSMGGVSGYGETGGLVGYNNSGAITNSFWDIQTSGQTTSAGGEGKTTAEMKTKSTFTDAGWDFLTIWNIIEGSSYPFFKRGTYRGGTGTPDDPYKIAKAEDFLELAGTPTDYNKCFILTADIDLDPNLPNGQIFTGACIAADTNSSSGFQGTAFTGTFDGSGYAITNFAINGGSNWYLGLFGYIDSGGQIKNLSIEGFAVSNGYSRVGGLAGYNYGSISNCYSTGSVSGYGEVGGLVGYNYGSISDCYSTGVVVGDSQRIGGLVGYNYISSISDCYSTGSVSGYGEVGGLVGYNYIGSISDCYSTGSVSGCGEVGVGGLVGYSHSGSIIKCYSTGSVSGSGWEVGGLLGEHYYCSISSCYFLITSGPDNGHGEALTDEEMKQQSSFIGWDFTNETANGTNDYWRMCVDGVDYPQLNWESITGDFACPDGVNIEDLDYFVQRWLTTNCNSANNYCGGTDINGSGAVEFADFAIFAQHWLQQN